MKVRMLVSIAGGAEPLYGLEEFSFRPGEEVDLDDTLAGHWIAAGHASAVKAPAPSPRPNKPAAKTQEGS